ncbi:hypothetical protein BKA80DRAFT_256220 [Phyllosticta citrichinensis]
MWKDGTTQNKPSSATVGLIHPPPLLRAYWAEKKEKVDHSSRAHQPTLQSPRALTILTSFNLVQRIVADFAFGTDTSTTVCRPRVPQLAEPAGMGSVFNTWDEFRDVKDDADRAVWQR